MSGRGNYTFVSNEGFIAFTKNTVYNAIFRYNAFELEDGKTIYESDCSKTIIGWFHAIDKFGHMPEDSEESHWGCFYGIKNPKSEEMGDQVHLEDFDGNVVLSEGSHKFGRENFPVLEPGTKVQRGDGRASELGGSSPVEEEDIYKFLESTLEEMTEDDLPAFWDWRDVNGVDFTSPVISQGDCGSCYIHSTLSSIESRVRIMTRNEQKPKFST